MNSLLFTLKRCKKSVLLLSATSLLFLGCGKKKKNIFFFPPQSKETLTINKLMLPALKQARCKTVSNVTSLEWQPIDTSALTSLHPDIEFLGYYIYAFHNQGFIPRKPLNSSPQRTTRFDIAQPAFPKASARYLITSVFKIGDQHVEGPASKIVGEGL